MMYNEPRMVLVTGEHCITPEVREQLDSLYRDPTYQTKFSCNYMSFDQFSVTSTWEAEPYILYDGETPVGIMKPSFDRMSMHVTNILPRIFPKYRKMGYGSYMFAWTIDNYFKKGWQKICTQVWSNNHASLMLNRKFLNEEAVRPEHQIIAGKYYDSHFFGLIKHRYDRAEGRVEVAEYRIRKAVEQTLGEAAGIKFPGI